VVLLPSGVTPLLGTIGPHESGSSQAALDGGTVKDEGIFHIVAVIGYDGHDEVLPRRALVEGHEVHRLGLDHGLLWVVQDVAAGVRPLPIVGAAQT